MSITLEQLKAQREALQAARFNGVLTVKAGDKWGTYKSDAELQSALGDLEREIAKAEGRQCARRIRTYAGKGVCVLTISGISWVYEWQRGHQAAGS